MKIRLLCSIFSLWLFLVQSASGIDPATLSNEFKQLPTVPEYQQQALSNWPGGFRGKIHLDGFQGKTWVSFPHVENPGSFGFDRKGRLYVVEANRFWLGVPDMRRTPEMVPDDFKSKTVADRLAMYEKFSANFPAGWFEKVADRIIRLEDTDGNGAADKRSVFSDRFKEKADGIGFSVLADEDNTVYFTCIPNLWKITDTDDDGVADQHKVISTGYGVRVSFIGHDLHGIIRGPDGMLYYSVGDRGYHITGGDGKTYAGAGRGAIFRCESDGSGLEVYCTGLRNPQEIAFDDFGNLFTFDNTGDIGDKARMVYALQGTDSGWYMAHQSPHHYAPDLDWGEFRPEKAMWPAERMFDTYNKEQPQWVYPPASLVGDGPSGFTYLTGESIAENMRSKFLVSDYGGSLARSKTHLISVEKKGAGFVVKDSEHFVTGLAASDVELGFDGKIYLCDYGGGWSVNTNGSVQVIESTDWTQKEAGKQVAKLFKEGFEQRGNDELYDYLSHPDKRVRHAAQLALVKSADGHVKLVQAALESDSLLARVHGVWGLGQLLRTKGRHQTELVRLLRDPEEEIRANVVRTLGDSKPSNVFDEILDRLENDHSIRVRSLAAIAIGRITTPGNEQAVKALFSQARRNAADGDPDIVLRHALLSSLDRLGTERMAANKVGSDSEEERLLAVLFLRRKVSAGLGEYLDDPSALIRRDVVRAIYDTDLVDTGLGKQIAALAPKEFPETVQRRIMAANYRIGGADQARQLVAMAGNDAVAMSVRKAAFQALLRWEQTIDTDTVLGTNRPILTNSQRSLVELGRSIGGQLGGFLSEDHPSELISLAIQVASKAGVDTGVQTLVAQVRNEHFETSVRLAALNSLIENNYPQLDTLLSEVYTSGDNPTLQAVALTKLFATQPSPALADQAVAHIKDSALPVARVAINSLAQYDVDRWVEVWQSQDEPLRQHLQLDGYLALQAHAPEVARRYAGTDPNRIHRLSLWGGDHAAGEQVYNNQGACRQCHKVEQDGGIQGPDLSNVANRLSRKQILTSIYNPSLEIADGYGTSLLTLTDGSSVAGRMAAQNDTEVTIIGADGSQRVVPRIQIASLTPPVSAMPPLGAALPPKELRDLVAYVARLGIRPAKQIVVDPDAHGDPAEAYAK